MEATAAGLASFTFMTAAGYTLAAAKCLAVALCNGRRTNAHTCCIVGNL